MPMITALPILIPFTLIISFLFIRSDRMARRLGIAGTMLLLILSVALLFQVDQQQLLVLQMGGWEAPFGITLAIDYLSALMLVIASVILFAIALYAPHDLGTMRLRQFYIFFF